MMVDHFQLASSVLDSVADATYCIDLASSVMIPEPRGPVQFSYCTYCRTRTYPSLSEPWSPSAEIYDGTISRLLRSFYG
jgi:hypothetical protein